MALPPSESPCRARLRPRVNLASAEASSEEAKRRSEREESEFLSRSDFGDSRILKFEDWGLASIADNLTFIGNFVVFTEVLSIQLNWEKTMNWSFRGGEL